MRSRTAAIVAILALVAAALFWRFAWPRLSAPEAAAPGAGGGMPPANVTALVAGTSTWAPHLEATGTVRAVQGIDVAPEVAGQVAAIRFESGSRVKAGDVLVELDTDLERAELARLEAAAGLAESSLARQRKLAARDSTSRAALDEAEASRATTSAALSSERVRLSKRTIRAPFAGVLGLRRVDVGAYVTPGMALVSLQQTDPLYVDFSLPQRERAAVEVGQHVTFGVDAYPGRDFAGTIEAIEPRVDLGTRTFAVRAHVPNTDGALAPGMFGRVKLELAGARELVTLPQTAISYNPYGDYAFVVQDGEPLTVHQVFVRTGDHRGDQVAVLAGVEPGDRVVTSGQLKLREGAPIRIDDDVHPTNDPSPTFESQG